jgi:CRP-like cAMP-binding protein
MKLSAERTGAIDRLRELRQLHGATNKELVRIDRLTYEVEVPAGHVITREGEQSRGFCLIVAGSAAVTVAGTDRGVLNSGMFFGETALLDGAPEPATVTALTPMKLRVASRREFALLSEVRAFARAMLQTLAAQQRVAYGNGGDRSVRPA